MNGHKTNKTVSQMTLWLREKYPRNHVKSRVYSECGLMLLLLLIGLWSIAEANGGWWAVMVFGFTLKTPVLYHITNVMIILLFVLAFSDIILMIMTRPLKTKA